MTKVSRSSAALISRIVDQTTMGIASSNGIEHRAPNPFQDIALPQNNEKMGQPLGNGTSLGSFAYITSLIMTIRSALEGKTSIREINGAIRNQRPINSRLMDAVRKICSTISCYNFSALNEYLSDVKRFESDLIANDRGENIKPGVVFDAFRLTSQCPKNASQLFKGLSAILSEQLNEFRDSYPLEVQDQTTLFLAISGVLQEFMYQKLVHEIDSNPSIFLRTRLATLRHSFGTRIAELFVFNHPERIELRRFINRCRVINIDDLEFKKESSNRERTERMIKTLYSDIFGILRDSVLYPIHFDTIERVKYNPEFRGFAQKSQGPFANPKFPPYTFLIRDFFSDQCRHLAYLPSSEGYESTIGLIAPTFKGFKLRFDRIELDDCAILKALPMYINLFGDFNFDYHSTCFKVLPNHMGELTRAIFDAREVIYRVCAFAPKLFLTKELTLPQRTLVIIDPNRITLGLLHGDNPNRFHTNYDFTPADEPAHDYELNIRNTKRFGFWNVGVKGENFSLSAPYRNPFDEAEMLIALHTNSTFDAFAEFCRTFGCTLIKDPDRARVNIVARKYHGIERMITRNSWPKTIYQSKLANHFVDSWLNLGLRVDDLICKLRARIYIDPNLKIKDLLSK